MSFQHLEMTETQSKQLVNLELSFPTAFSWLPGNKISQFSRRIPLASIVKFVEND